MCFFFNFSLHISWMCAHSINSPPAPNDQCFMRTQCERCEYKFLISITKEFFFLVGVSVAFAVLIARKWNVNNTIRNISILLSLKHCSDGSLFEHIARFLLEIEKTPRYTIQIRWRETGNYLNWEHLFTELNWELCIALEWLCHWFGWMKACGISLCLVVTVSS